MTITFIVLLGVVVGLAVAVVGGAVALSAGHRRAGLALMAAGLLLAVGLPVLLLLSVQNM